MMQIMDVIIGIMHTIIHLLIVKRALRALLGPEKKSVLSNVLWVLYFGFTFCGAYFISFRGGFLLLGNLIFVSSIATITRYSPIKVKIFFSAMIFSVWMMVEVAVSLFIMGFNLQPLIPSPMTDFTALFIMLLIVRIVENVRLEKNYLDISKKRFFLLMWVPFTTVLLAYQILKIALKYPEYKNLAVFAAGLFLLTNYIIFELYDFINKSFQIDANNKMFIKQLEMCERQTAEQEEMYEDFRRLRHDIKNHLAGIKGMLETGDSKGAEKYIDNILSDECLNNKKFVCNSGNIIIDSLINNKYTIAVSKDIRFNINISIPSNMKFKNEHLVVILGNLLDNAIEACEQVEGVGKFISMDVSYEKNMLHISVKNSTNGIKHKIVEGLIQTTKKDCVNHGIGLLSVKKAAEFYYGDLQLKDLGNEFVAIVVLYEG